MALFIAFLSFILSTTARDSGDYFPNYNQSEFVWSGSSKGYCTLKANYETGGRPDTNSAYNWEGCEKTKLEYESQQEFDLTYWELLKVCPFLLKTPEPERGVVDWSTQGKGKGRYLLPNKLVWSTECDSNDFNSGNQWTGFGFNDALQWCPRWQCDNSSALWDRDYNASFTYQEITQLSWSSKPLQSTCWKCHCKYWANGGDWVWTCDDTYASHPNGGNGGEGGKGWYEQTYNPIDDPFIYPTRKCMAPTPGPTPQPTDTTPGPTPGPTDTAVAPITCANVWDAWNQQGEVYPGQYYWQSTATDDCSTISLCKCQDDGTGYCKSSYSEIMSDTELYPEFLERCGKSGNGGRLSECWTPDKANQLFQYYDFSSNTLPHTTWPNICDYDDWPNIFCPRCGCTTDPWTQSARTNGTSNTTVYQRAQNYSKPLSQRIYEYTCTECDCEFDPNSPRGAVSYMDCNGGYDYDDTNNDEQYPSDLSVDCFYTDRRCFSNWGEYEADAGSTPCNDQRTGSGSFNNYCSFTRKTLEDSAAENICVEDQDEIIGYWGCGTSWRCDLLNTKYESETGCYKADYTYKVAQYDCINDKWVGDNYKAKMRYSCCNDKWNCNNRTIDEYLEDKCTTSDELKEYNMFSDSCYYSQRNLYDLTDDESIIRAAFCGDRLDYDKFESETDAEQDSTEAYCTLLKVYWQYHTFCSCNEKRIMIKYLTESDPQLKDTDLMIKYFKNDFWGGSDDNGVGFKTLRNRLTVMYEYWGCIDYETDSTVTNADTFFTCDFDEDIAKIDNEAVSFGAANNIFSYWSYIIVLISFLFNTKHNRFLSIFLIGLFGIMYVNAATDYDYDMVTSTGEWNKCEFRGVIDTDNSAICEQITYEKSVFQNEDLTWDVLLESCPSLEYAGCWTKDKQLDMDKLVWPNEDNACGTCPQCPCTNATDTIRHYVKERYNLVPDNDMIRQTCYQCSCVWNVYAEDYGFSCWSTGTQRPPYMFNDTEFCPGTDAPTSAPTQPLQIECVTGSGDFDNLNANQYSMNGESGRSHCGWQNITRERYPNAEPAICVSDDIVPYSQWFASSNTYGICQALAGSGSGCYYTQYDQNLKQYDCARKKWITDKYRVGATVYCCNDGYYCNNQTMVTGGGEPNEVQYYSYDNKTEIAKCKNSGKLKEWMQNQYCDYNYHADVDDSYLYKHICKSGVTDSKPTCDDLTKFWNAYSHCRCKRATWWRGSVNSTYKEYIDDDFEVQNAGIAGSLIDWNDTLDCGWKPGTKWYCGSANYHGVSIIAVIFIAVSYVFV